MIWWSQQLTVETVHLRDLPALMVPAQQRDAVGPLGLQDQQVGEGLQAVVTPVHKVPLNTQGSAELAHTTLSELLIT